MEYPLTEPLAYQWLAQRIFKRAFGTICHRYPNILFSRIVKVILAVFSAMAGSAYQAKTSS
jgi:hypothetical protein